MAVASLAVVVRVTAISFYGTAGAGAAETAAGNADGAAVAAEMARFSVKEFVVFAEMNLVVRVCGGILYL